MTKAQHRFLEKVKQRRARAAAALTSDQADGVSLGSDGRLVMNESERERTAYHEAGHAVIYAVLGIRFRLVTIKPSGILLGRTERRRLPIGFWRGQRVSRSFIEDRIMGALSGGIAEGLAREDGSASGLSQDLGEARWLIRCIPGCRTVCGRVQKHQRLHARADALVRHHWDAIDEVAEMLLDEDTLREPQVLRVLREDGEWVLRELEAMMIAEGEMPRGLLVTREAHNVPMEVAEIEAAIAELLSDVQKLPAPRFGSAS